MENYFGNTRLTPEEAISVLEMNCASQREMSFMKSIPDEEVQKAKDDLAQHAIRRRRIEAEKKAAMGKFNAELKELGKHYNETLDVIETGGVEVEEIVYDVADFDNRSMITYDNSGNWLASRPMTPEERQRDIPRDLAYLANNGGRLDG